MGHSRVQIGVSTKGRTNGHFRGIQLHMLRSRTVSIARIATVFAEIFRIRRVNLELKRKIFSTQCLKITEKVSFNIASEASYVYILSGQKLIKNAKNGPFWRVFENLKLVVEQCYQTGQF